jgi:hypothetical protein
MKFEKIFHKMHELNKKEQKNIIEKNAKLNEEVGELSAELLKMCGLKGSKGKTLAEIKYEALLECADCFLMIMAICDDLGYDAEEFLAGCAQKMVKYEHNLDKQKEWKVE